MTGSKYLILEENCTHHFLTHRSVLNRSGGISGIAIKGEFNLYPGSCRLWIKWTLQPFGHPTRAALPKWTVITPCFGRNLCQLGAIHLAHRSQHDLSCSWDFKRVSLCWAIMFRKFWWLADESPYFSDCLFWSDGCGFLAITWAFYETPTDRKWGAVNGYQAGAK